MAFSYAFSYKCRRGRQLLRVVWETTAPFTKVLCIMQKIYRGWGLIAVLAGLSVAGCASQYQDRGGTFSGSGAFGFEQTVDVRPDPLDAVCRVTGRDFQQETRGRQIVSVPVLAAPVSVECSAPGHHASRQTLNMWKRDSSDLLIMAGIGGGLGGILSHALLESAGQGDRFAPIAVMPLEPVNLQDQERAAWRARKYAFMTAEWQAYAQGQRTICDADAPKWIVTCDEAQVDQLMRLELVKFRDGSAPVAAGLPPQPVPLPPPVAASQLAVAPTPAPAVVQQEWRVRSGRGVVVGRLVGSRFSCTSFPARLSVAGQRAEGEFHLAEGWKVGFTADIDEKGNLRPLRIDPNWGLAVSGSIHSIRLEMLGAGGQGGCTIMFTLREDAASPSQPAN
ncbi:MAG: hypothetical protein HY057_03430 [Rhodospirillales bacterium]|nr:hypothetical protein [Rhodospirillales bacterium]